MDTTPPQRLRGDTADIKGRFPAGWFPKVGVGMEGKKTPKIGYSKLQIEQKAMVRLKDDSASFWGPVLVTFQGLLLLLNFGRLFSCR